MHSIAEEFFVFIARQVHKTEKCSQQKETKVKRLNASKLEMVHGDDNMKYDRENS